MSQFDFDLPPVEASKDNLRYWLIEARQELAKLRDWRNHAEIWLSMQRGIIADLEARLEPHDWQRTRAVRPPWDTERLLGWVAEGGILPHPEIVLWNDGAFWIWADEDWTKTDCVTHWLELPGAPREAA